ncbi:TrkH family potassium uptake protein [uncultured Tateyamaria sp.]|uniref:TrkH family potassium uptake protein n=3 Tax=uncultured Tateyamaria sp. TaxID=455651 RepID=UPI0026230535|nr:potassium transporter TrkG [uncultured Tateyamaria sp.]
MQSAGNGADTLMQRARPGALALVMAKHGALAALLFGPPLIWALAEGQMDLAVALCAPILLGLMVWLSTWRQPLPDDLRGVEAMASIALLFLLAALLSIPAFMVLGLGPASALFEGMSAITTTGLSVAPDPDSWPFAAHVLRSWMQWCGGLAMATAVLALVLGPGPAARTIGKAGIDDRNRIQSARSQARELLGAYALLTIGFAVAIALAVQDGPEGFVLALSAISTGGFAPRSDSLGSYTTFAQGVVILACLAGAVSLLAFTQTLRRNGTPIWRSDSVRRVGLATLACAGALAAVMAVTDTTDTYVPTLLNLISALTTAGYATGSMPVTPALLAVFILAMVVGGDRGSTAGGLKLSRLGITARATRHALTLPRLPERAISPLRYQGATIKDTFLVALLGLIILYTLSVGAVWMILLSLGFPALPALFDTVSALSTVGLSTGVISPDLPTSAQLVLAFAMWLGRLEFIAVIVLFLPGTWMGRLSTKG